MPRHRHLVTLTLFLLPLLLGAWLLPSLTRYAVNRTLNNSMDILSRTYEQRRQILSASISVMLLVSTTIVAVQISACCVHRRTRISMCG